MNSAGGSHASGNHVLDNRIKRSALLLGVDNLCPRPTGPGWGRLPHTKPLRTLVDVTNAHFSPGLFEQAVFQALARGQVTPAEAKASGVGHPFLLAKLDAPQED